ncbi:molybdopterin molybdotransferase MoeA [Cerasicoccus arenae]|uniref:Molybdopterin molybdenumtransferase n=1 Tax=Cerasicoccus arenae TaxID=424488 RepID=A0A8J3DBT2_9BACT|nr:molybdopterin molybdotransferase MoeA [Cerasicoccus arenae]MBK1857256.1 molybdopterin molybdotransferase MoeA [Cerasicoccus arenae]GHC00312.1 molybdopterin molybdenumtransferase MoeA [Cerasicoccus arenae]
MTELISVAEADARIAAIVQLAPAIKCPLSKAAGRVLREDVLADRPLPPFDRVMMDGYAIRYKAIAECGGEFQICGQTFAGEATGKLGAASNAAMEIMTGAPLPLGADTIVPYEDTERNGDVLKLLASDEVELGEFIHRLGSDFAAKSKLVGAGSLLGPVEMGVAASCGYTEVLVSPRPRITVVGTGDELVAVDQTPLPHQIRASNATTLESALALAKYHVGDIDHWPDDAVHGRERLRVVLSRSDVVVIAGAVSKGQRDWIPTALDEVAECIFHGVYQRPGKPMGVWLTSDGRVIFALPGNPVSALVGLHRYVLPYLRQREGGAPKSVPHVSLGQAVSFAPPLTWFLSVRLESDRLAFPMPVNNSGDYARLCGTDGFIELSADCSEWTAGFEAPFYRWSS